MPKVSILFPIYNTAPYLAEAMDSMLSQTFNDFELIVLNDCSPDNSEDILNQYTDKRIVRYRGNVNVGLGNILNIGIKMATGKYIARMDSDDISMPERLKYQVDFLDSHPDIDLLSVGMEEFGTESSRVYRYDNDTEVIKFNALFFSPVLHASSMWRKDRFCNLLYNQSFVPSEDYDLWTRALIKGLKFRNLPIILYKYRRYSGQATSNPDLTAWNHVQRNYLISAFQHTPVSKIDFWIKAINDCDAIDSLKTIFQEMSVSNKVDCFFDDREFKKNARYYYQSHLFTQIISGKEGCIWDLNIKQIVKIVLKRATDYVKKI